MTATSSVVGLLYQAYNGHDAEAAARLYSDDGRHHEVAQGREASGPPEIQSGLEHFFRAFPDSRWRPLRTIVSADEAAITYELTGTLTEWLGPFAPNKQRLVLRGVHVIAVEDGAIKTSEDYWDSASFGRQMAAS